jgi:hypothetical protein
MKIIDNTSLLLGDDLKEMVTRGARLKVAASCPFYGAAQYRRTAHRMRARSK